MVRQSVTITEVVTPVAMRLDLPLHMSVHPVIHVSQMREYKTSEAFPERVEPEPPAPISLEGQEYYAIEALRNHRFVRAITVLSQVGRLHRRA